MSESRQYRELMQLYNQEKSKYAASCAHQTELEQDLAAQESQYSNLTREHADIRSQLHKLQKRAEEDAQSYIQTQFNYIEQINQLNNDVNSLNQKIKASDKKNNELEDQVSMLSKQNQILHQQLVAKSNSPKKYVAATHPPPGTATGTTGTAPGTATGTTSHLGEMRDSKQFVISELKSRIQHLKNEIAELKTINENQHKQNEQYQILLMEKTVNSALEEKESTSLEDSEFLNTDLEDTELKKKLNEQNFQLKSLRNYNDALRTTLEQLVSRLLDDPNLSKSMNTSRIDQFKAQIESKDLSLYGNPNRRLSLGGGNPANQGNLGRGPPYLFTNFINPRRKSMHEMQRVVSLGVDVDATPAPQVSWGGHQRTNSESSINSIGERVDNITKLRKLRLKSK